MFSDTPYSNKPNTMRSVRFRRINTDKGIKLNHAMYTHMFQQDVQLGIVPIGREAINKLSININPHSDKVEELIKLSLPTRNGYSRNLAECVCGFMENVVGHLVYYGKAYYEIVYFYADESKKEVIGFTVYPIFNDNIKELFGIFWQHVPKNIYGDKDEYPKRFIWLPKDDILALSFPKELGGFNGFEKLLSRLHWLSKTMPEFVMSDMEKNKRTLGYNSSTYIENQENYLAKVTHHLGWNARGIFSKRSLEFYQIYRYLIFERSKAILREYILDKLNECLVRIGKKMDFKVCITIEGIRSSYDINKYIGQLVTGKLQFSDVFNLMKSTT